MTIQLVMFDMDGVLFEGANFWLDLHHAYGTTSAGIALAERHMTSDYQQLADLVAGQLWKGKPAAPYLDLVTARSYQAGAHELFAALHARQIKTAIISTGPYHLAERAQAELGIDVIRANRLLIAGGRLTGGADIAVHENDKVSIARSVAQSLDVELPHAAYVGDSDGDVGPASVVGLPVAYNSTSAKLLAVATHAIPHGDLIQLANLL